MGLALFAGSVLFVGGVVMLVQGARADRAVRRGQHTRGRIVAATKAHMTDDGRRFWNVQVSFPADAGQQVSVWARQIGQDVDRRIGEEVDVWFDPHRPERARVVLAGNAAGTFWIQYAIGAALSVGGAAVLITRLA